MKILQERKRGWVRVKMSYFNERGRLSRLTVVVIDILKNVNAKVTLKTLSSSKVRELPTQTAYVLFKASSLVPPPSTSNEVL